MKTLILHASAGGGHLRAAEALAEAARCRGHVPVVRDILDFTPPHYRHTYAKGYLAVVRSAPEFWGMLYSQTDRSAQIPMERRIRTLFNHLHALSFHRFLERTAPDLVLCTHFLPLELIGSKYPPHRRQFALYGIVTDFAAHSLWYCRNVDGYFVASEEAALQLSRMGQTPAGIRCTGIPVLSGFRAGRSPAAARFRLGLPPAERMVLVLNGGLGVGPGLGLLRAAAETPPAGHLVLIAGRNPRLESRLRKLAAHLPFPVTIRGYVDNMPDWMDAADLVVSKPGGLTMAETLSQGKPLLLMDPIPGQEQRNAEYLLEAGCAVRAFTPEEALWKINRLFRHPRRLQALAAQARHRGRPDAADEILRQSIRNRPPQHPAAAPKDRPTPRRAPAAVSSVLL